MDSESRSTDQQSSRRSGGLPPKRSHAVSSAPLLVSLVVLDGATPGEWTPWSSRLKDLDQELARISIPLLDEYSWLEKYQVRLILDTPSDLDARRDNELARVIGVLIDGSTPGDPRILRDRFRALLLRLRRLGNEAWLNGLGFYVLITMPLKGNTATERFRQEIDESLSAAFGLSAPVASAVPEESTFSYQIREVTHYIATKAARNRFVPNAGK